METLAWFKVILFSLDAPQKNTERGTLCLLAEIRISSSCNRATSLLTHYLRKKETRETNQLALQTVLPKTAHKKNAVPD